MSAHPNENSLGELSQRLGHQFSDPALLDRALAHRSWCAEHGDAVSNERLEFLGDAVLGWVVADLAFHRFGDLPEGQLTEIRKSVVNGGALADAADDIGLGPFIKLGRGEAAADGASKPSILSDAFEAVLGAVYLDGGTDAAFALIERTVGPRLQATPEDHVDHKTALQELCARLGRSAPSYELSSVGPDHAKIFTAVVSVNGTEQGRGEGRSKKAAEQVAAASAIDAMS